MIIIFEVGVTSSNFKCSSVELGIKWTPDSDFAPKVISTYKNFSFLVSRKA